jgi:putative hemolysin
VWLVRGDAPVRELDRTFELGLETPGGATTLGGLCVELAGEIPEPERWLEGPGGVRLEIVDSSPRRVLVVRMHLPARSEPVPAAE